MFGLKLTLVVVGIMVRAVTVTNAVDTTKSSTSLRGGGSEGGRSRELQQLPGDIQQQILELQLLIETLTERIVQVESDNMILRTRIEAHEEEQQEKATNSCIEEDNLEAGTLVISGCNLIIENGMNSTETTNGRGNVIIGYPEEHNLQNETYFNRCIW